MAMFHSKTFVYIIKGLNLCCGMVECWVEKVNLNLGGFMPSTRRRTTSTPKRVHAKVRSLESKLGQTERKLRSESKKFGQYRKNLIQACKQEIKSLSGIKHPSKNTKTYKMTQKKIQNLKREVKQVNRKITFKC